MYTLKTRSGMLGCVSDSKTYVVGFNNLKMASRVSSILKTPPKLTLTRKHTIDVTDDIKSGLEELGLELDFELTSVNLDTEAVLTIEKSENPDNQHNQVEVDLMDAGDFMFMSFGNNVGLIMPFKMHYEDSNQLLFKSSVVEPCNDVKTFKKFLQ